MDARSRTNSRARRSAWLALGCLAAAGFALGLACGSDKKEADTTPTSTVATSGDATSTPELNLTPRPTEQSTPSAGGPESPPAVTGQPTVTADGLQIIDIVVGSGAVAEVGKTITVHTTGWLADGTKFYSSLDSPGTPLMSPLISGQGGFMDGWVEGVPGMKVGGQRRLIIPAALGYGAAGRPPSIPPDAELTFDIELLDVQ